MANKNKRKRKVELPTDKHGIPIYVGDIMQWEDGVERIESLTYYGDEFDPLGFRWVANAEEDCIDNLAGGEVIWKAAKQ